MDVAYMVHDNRILIKHQILKVGMNCHKRAQRVRWREWVRKWRKCGMERMVTVSGLRDGGRGYFVGIENYEGLVII